MKRKAFRLQASASALVRRHPLSAAVVAAAIPLSGSTGCESKSACAKNGVVADISGNHEHAMSVSTSHIEREVGGVYPVKGAADHQHDLKLSDAEMEKLKAGEAVTARSSSVEAHVHEVALRCKE